jgi:hypothetical protein
VLDQGAIAGLLQQHLERRWDWQHELWSVLVLETWFREVVERARVPAAA